MTRLGPYILLNQIGEGGMGQVWAARDEHLKRDVAVKLITGERTTEPRYRKRFRTEVQSMARLDHRGVVEVFDSLSAEIALDTQIYAIQQSRKFTDSLLSCANNGGVGTNDRFFDSGQCVYVEVEGSLYNRDETSDNLGFRASDFSFSVGGQLVIGEDWNLGGAFRYANSSLTASQASSTSEGNQYFAGVSAKRRFENIELGAAFGFGYGSFDNKRAPLGASASGEWRGSATKAAQSRYSSQSQRWRTKVSSARPSVTMTCAIAVSTATLVPGCSGR